MEAFTYKGISDGKYVEGEIEALNQDEASFKLKEQKVIITNLIKTKKKRAKLKRKVKSQAFHFSVVKKSLKQKTYLFSQNNLQPWSKLVYQYWKYWVC